MGTLNFSSAFSFYKVRTDSVLTNIPAYSIRAKISADDLSGTYTIEYPNPKGFCTNRFVHFQIQEIHFADPETKSMQHVFTGQINGIQTVLEKNTLTINGRGLSGYLTDRKVNDSYSEKRVDYIIADPIYGIIPRAFESQITTWNSFTDHFDRFDFWDVAYWGSQQTYTEIYSGNLEFSGAGGSIRDLLSTESYTYETFETSLKNSTASNTICFGFSDATISNYCFFVLTNTGINCVTKSTTGTTTTAVSSPPSQTINRYYRIEWASDEVRFFIDGLLVATNTTNIPAIALKLAFEIDNSASILTIDYVKAIILTQKIPLFIAKNQIMSDTIKTLCDIGTANEPFSFFIDKDFDFNAKVILSISSGLSFGYNSTLYNTKNQRIAKITLNEEAKDLYNSVRIEGGEKLTTISAPSYTETQLGNGTTQTFPLGFKAQKPMSEVKVGATVYTEGTDYEVIYGQETSIVKFLTITPGNGTTIYFRYNYFKPIIATAGNSVSQAQYGVKREYTKTDDTINDQTRAQQLANAFLSFFKDPRTVIKILVSIRPKLNIGNTVVVDAPYAEINNSTYQVIELEHSISKGVSTSQLTLASVDIDTNAEIIREILQQLKDLRTKGETNSLIIDEQSIEETLTSSESLLLDTTWVCDSFILGTSDNGKFGLGAILDNFESAVVANWTGSGFSVSAGATAIVGSGSMQLDYSGVATKTVTTSQSFGDLSNWTGISIVY